MICLYFHPQFDYIVLKLFSFPTCFDRMGLFLVFVITSSVIMFQDDIVFRYPMEGYVVDFDIELYFFSWGLCLVFRRNSIEFSVDVRVLEYFGLSCLCRFRYPFFKWVLISMYALRVLERCFGKSGPSQGHATVAMCSTFKSGQDILIGIRADGF